MSTERGMAIQEAVRAMGEERYLRQLAQQRDRRMAQKKRKAEGSAAVPDAEKEKQRKEALKEYQKEWRAKNKDKVKEYNRRYQRKKKEADATTIATTSSGLTEKKPLDNYTKESEECQDVKSDTPGYTSGGEIRQQRRAELPVYLL